MTTETVGIHQATYDAVFQHPVARNLQWRDVKTMLESIAEMTEEHSGNVKFSRNGQTLTVHPSKHKDVSDIEEMMKIRHFLDKSSAPEQAATGDGKHLLVVIDHREGRIFKTELQGTTPERIVPLDPNGSHRHLHNVEKNSDGQVKPELKSFYEAIAHSLGGAEKILIMGSATGSSSAMDHLVEELKKHHGDIAGRIVGTVVVNECI